MLSLEKDCEENAKNVASVRNAANTRNIANVTKVTDFGNISDTKSIEKIRQNFTLPILAFSINKSVNALRFSNLAKNFKILDIRETFNPSVLPDSAKVNSLKKTLKLSNNQKVVGLNIDFNVDHNGDNADYNADHKIDHTVDHNTPNSCVISSNNTVVKKPTIQLKVKDNKPVINFDGLLTKNFFEQGCLNGFEIKHIADHNKIHGINIYLHYDFFKTLFFFKKNLSDSETKSLKNLRIKLISKSILKKHLAKGHAKKNLRNYKNYKFLNNKNRNKINEGKLESEVANKWKNSTVIRFKNRSTFFEYNPNEDVITGMENLEKINKILEIKSSLKITINKNQLIENSGAASCDNVDIEEFIKSYQLYELRKFQNLNSIAELRLRQLEIYYNTYKNI